MKTLKVIFLFLFFSCLIKANAQIFDDLKFGSDSTFEVMTWNVEWFPKNGQTTVDYVVELIEAIDVDIIALQEIDDKSAFAQVISELEEYTGFYINDDWASLAYIYRSDLEVLDISERFTSYDREFPRAPLFMELFFNDVKFVIINNHFKCCGDGIIDHSNPWDEEKRRLDACVLLDDYIRTVYPDDRIILLGDLNDVLTDDYQNNVFQPFLDNPYDYQFADMAIAEDTSDFWSYPAWPSHLDHIMLSNELFYDFNDERSVVQTIMIDEVFPGGFYGYDDNVSDHRPVAIRFPVPENFGIEEAEVINFQLYPNPVTEVLGVRSPRLRSGQGYVLGISANLSLCLYDSFGRKVMELPLRGIENHQIDVSDLPGGMYVVVVEGEDGLLLREKVIISH